MKKSINMPGVDTLHRFTSAVSPVNFTFVASLALSTIAVSRDILDRDGMLYAQTARAFMDGGMAAALKVFSWPFLSILMALLAKLTGLPPEWCGHALNIVFMSGACALLVAITQRNDKSLAWLAAIVILAIPGINGYRDQLMREYGCWFFLLLSFRLTLDWPEKPDWPRCLAIQVSLFLAALFRPEALAFYLCIVLWQHFQTPSARRWRNSLMLGALPSLALILLVSAYFMGALGESSRLTNEFHRFDFYSGFDTTARNMSQAFNVYARESAKTAHTILFFGSLALIPWRYLGTLGPFIIPLIYFLSTPGWRQRYRRHSLLLWALGAYLLILAVFVLQQQFIAGRYIGPMILFSLPLILYGLHDLLNRWPRLRWPVVTLCALLALHNVVSLNPGKQYFREAGRWLGSQYVEAPNIYLESSRAAHYAGWKFKERISPLPREELLKNIGQYEAVILEVSSGDENIASWVAEAGLQEIRRFTNRNGDAVIVYVPAGHSLPPPTASEKGG